MFLEAIENLEPKTAEPELRRPKKVESERLAALSGDRIAPEKVLSSEKQREWKEKSKEEDSFLAAVDEFAQSKREKTKQPLATLGEQLDFQQVSAKVSASKSEKLAQKAEDLPKVEAKEEKDSKIDLHTPTIEELEEREDADLFLQAWDKLAKKRPAEIENDALADLSRKWQRIHKDKPAQAKRPLEEDLDSKLFLRAVNKLDEKKPKAKTEKQLTTLGEQCPALSQAKPKDAPKKVKPKKKIKNEAIVSQEDEQAAFLKAVSGTEPLKNNRVIKPESPQVKIRTPDQENLADLLEGKYSFEFFCRDEYFEGNIIGLDQATIDKLRCGMFSPEAHLDLHGFVVDQAYEAVCDFIKSAWFKGLRTILLVPGRGHNSFAGVGILRSHLQTWLTHDPLKRVVIAFCTAQPCDGGPGSVYVLLRKYKKKGRLQWHSHIDDYITI
ncbi:MAG: Smr/MutS family protein [Desulfovibrionaceae bacterium]|nr:Smr/MutS family protein [Desulfovibrionaceae bacterium]